MVSIDLENISDVILLEVSGELTFQFFKNFRLKGKKMTKEFFTKQQLEAAIIEYNLTELVNTLPPQNYIARHKKTVEDSIEALRNDFMLTPHLKAIPKKKGARTDKGKHSKRSIIEYLYGLNRYHTEQIEALEEEWVEAAIKFAKDNGCPINRRTTFRLKREAEEAKKAEERQKAKEEKRASIAEKMLKNVIADESLPYAGAIIDLTQPEVSKDLNSVALPLAENALVFIAVYPKDMLKALKLIEDLELAYVDNIVWDRDVQLPTGTWSKNQHTNILIALKGQPNEPVNEFQLESVHFDHKTTELLSLPDYYFSMMEEMCPGEQYLEVFSYRQFSDKWHVLKISKEEKEN